MIVFVAAAVSLACVAASTRRLAFVMDATWLDPARLLRALQGDRGRARHPRILAAIAAEAGAAWEREICDALAEGGPAGAARVNEQLRELDWRMQRWSRVPRVCASIASSSGFLLASLALRNGLTAASASPDGTMSDALQGLVTQALGVAAFGVAGTVWCIALQRQATQETRIRAVAADKLVERLETLLARLSTERGEPEPGAAS